MRSNVTAIRKTHMLSGFLTSHPPLLCLALLSNENLTFSNENLTFFESTRRKSAADTRRDAH